MRWVLPDKGTIGVYDENDYWLLPDFITNFIVGPSVFLSPPSLPSGPVRPAASAQSTSMLRLSAPGSDSQDSQIFNPHLAQRNDGTLLMSYVENDSEGNAKLLLKSKAPDQQWSPPITLVSDNMPKGDPTIGFAGNGDPIIVWTQLVSPDAPDAWAALMSGEVYWLRLDANMEPVFGPVRLTNDEEMDGAASLALNGDGVLTWGHLNNSNNIWDVRYATWDDETGFEIAPTILSQQDEYSWGIKIAQGPDQYSLALWVSGNQDEQGRIVDAVPMYRIWDEQIAGFSQAPQELPLWGIEGQSHSVNVAFAPDGRAVVVWSQLDPEGSYSVYANTYDPDSKIWGQPEQVMSNLLLVSPQINISSQGQVVVTASGYHNGGQIWTSNWNINDTATAWSEAEDVSQNDDFTYDVTTVFDDDDNLVMNWMSGSEQAEHIVVSPTIVELSSGSATYYDNDGSLVTIKLSKGQAELAFYGDNIEVVPGKRGVNITGDGLQLDNIKLTNSSDATSLTISTKGGSVAGANLGGITGDSLGKLNAKLIDLTGSLGSVILDDIAGNVTITASASSKGFSLKADEIHDGATFDLTGMVKSFQANSFVGGSLTADSIGKVAIKTGNFAADITARTGDILSLSTAGDITGKLSAQGAIKKIATKAGDFTGVARAGGEITSLQAMNLNGALISAGKNVKKVAVKGDILESFIFAGYDIGADVVFGAGDLLTGGDVLSVTAKGIFARSYIAAGTLPPSSMTNFLPDVGEDAGGGGSIVKVKFSGIDYDNASENFGLFAATTIKPFKVGKFLAQNQGFFVIE